MSPFAAATAMPFGVLTYITPSAGATPVAVVNQSQIVTSYIPEFTLCELPPIEFIPITPPSTLPTGASTAPYQNYSIYIPPGLGSCTTIYSEVHTQVCATTLIALATQYTVTNCNQDLTFSTRQGYVLAKATATADASLGASVNSSTAIVSATATASIDGSAMITAAPSIETLTTYYLAPWQQLTAGTAPSEVDLKVCRTFTNGTTECIREYQIWETILVTTTATTYTNINISTTIHGTSRIIVETFVANVTDELTTFSLHTTMALSFETEYTTTSSTTRGVALATSIGPTVYQTHTVKQVS